MEMERRIDEMMIANRMGSMRQMSTIHKEYTTFQIIHFVGI